MSAETCHHSLRKGPLAPFTSIVSTFLIFLNEGHVKMINKIAQMHVLNYFITLICDFQKLYISAFKYYLWPQFISVLSAV